jgi:hypothetical protein
MIMKAKPKSYYGHHKRPHEPPKTQSTSSHEVAQEEKVRSKKNYIQ